MFLTSGNSYYSVPLSGLIVQCKSGLRLSSPTIKFKLLSYSDLTKIDLMIASGIQDEEVFEEICKKCIEGLIYLPNEELDYDVSPAGIIPHIGNKILHHSREVCVDIPQTFSMFSANVTLIDQISAFVSRYTCTPIREIRDYPVDQLLREFAIIQAAFPNEVQPIVQEEETVSRVRG